MSQPAPMLTPRIDAALEEIEARGAGQDVPKLSRAVRFAVEKLALARDRVSLMMIADILKDE